MPKICLLYYKNILDLAFKRFFEEHNEYFTKVETKYVLGNEFNFFHIKKLFIKYISDEIKELVIPYSNENPNYYFIIGSCSPKNNLLMKYRDKGYFPLKLYNLIKMKYDIKYFISEKDISINLVKFNEVLIEIFNDLFKSRKNIDKYIGKKYRNLFFIQHRNLDCYCMYRIVKYLYGKTNCVNLHKEKLADIGQIIVSLNDLICKYVHSKRELIKSDDFKSIRDEISGYMKKCIDSCV